MPRRLYVDEITSVGGVDAGDNPAASVVFWKRRDTSKLDKHAVPGSIDARLDRIRRAWGEAHPHREGDPWSWITGVFADFVILEEGDDYYRVSYSVMGDDVTFGQREPIELETTIVTKQKDSAASADTTERTGTMPVDFTRIEDETLRSEIEAHVSELTQRVEAAEAAAASGTGSDDDVTKNLPPEAKAEIEKRDAEMADLRKRLDSEVAKRRAAEFLEKAKPLARLLGKPEDIAPVLDALEAAAPEAYAKLLSPLVAASQRTELASLFKEIGTAGDGESDPISKRDVWVAEYRKSHPDATVAQARAAFWAENPAEKAASREEG